MSYQYGGYVTRPGVLTTIGVLSILIASVSLLTDFGGFFFASIVSRVAITTAAAPAVAANPPAAPMQSAETEYVAPDGLSAGQRTIVIQGLGQVRPISD